MPLPDKHQMLYYVFFFHLFPNTSAQGALNVISFVFILILPIASAQEAPNNVFVSPTPLPEEPQIFYSVFLCTRFSQCFCLRSCFVISMVRDNMTVAFYFPNSSAREVSIV